MDETQISITIRPIYIERLVYWLIIIALSVLLIISWMKDDCSEAKCDLSQSGAQQGDLQAPPTAQEPTTPTAPAAAQQPAADEASCTDATKNGDETDADCGGSCGLKCGNGRACIKDGDCTSGACYNSTCVASKPVTPSGKLEFTLKTPDYATAVAKDSDNNTYNRVKVTGVTYKITNGLDTEMEGFIAKVFIKNKAGTSCLNQYTVGTCDDAYATFEIGKVASGKTLEEEHTFAESEYTTRMGRFLTEANGYDPADPSRDTFTVIVYLYGLDGEQIGTKPLSAYAEVNP